MNISARVRFFFNISLPSLHDYDVKIPNFTSSGGREHKTTTSFFFSWTILQSFTIQLQKNKKTKNQKKTPTFDELNEME